MRDRKLKITRKEDIFSIFSIRIKNETMKKLDEIANKSGGSRNDIINICLNFH